MIFFGSLFGSPPEKTTLKTSALCKNFVSMSNIDTEISLIFYAVSSKNIKEKLTEFVAKLKASMLDAVKKMFTVGKMLPWYKYLVLRQINIKQKSKFIDFITQLFVKKEKAVTLEFAKENVLENELNSARDLVHKLQNSMTQSLAKNDPILKVEFRDNDFSSKNDKDALFKQYYSVVSKYHELFKSLLTFIDSIPTEFVSEFNYHLKLLMKNTYQKILDLVKKSEYNQTFGLVNLKNQLDFEVVYNILLVLNQIDIFPGLGNHFLFNPLSLIKNNNELAMI